MNNLFGMYRNFISNPVQYLMQSRINLPSGMNNPNDIIQFMMDNGYVNQAQYNQAMQQYRNIKSNPAFMQMINGMKG